MPQRVALEAEHGAADEELDHRLRCPRADRSWAAWAGLLEHHVYRSDSRELEVGGVTDGQRSNESGLNRKCRTTRLIPPTPRKCPARGARVAARHASRAKAAVVSTQELTSVSVTDLSLSVAVPVVQRVPELHAASGSACHVFGDAFSFGVREPDSDTVKTALVHHL